MGYMVHLVSKAKSFFMPSQTKEKALNGEKKNTVAAGFRAQSPNFGVTKDDFFFDTRGYFESDCEDDFFSVNGEFTPSRGNTPNHQTGASSTPRVEKTVFLNQFPAPTGEPSPTGRKKLLELFSENLQSKEDGDAASAAEDSAHINRNPDTFNTDPEQPPELLNGTLNQSGFGDLKKKKEKSWKNAHCCLPSFQNFGYSERRQKAVPGQDHEFTVT